MKIDHILYESNCTGVRMWVCQITECDGLRFWRSERVVGKSKHNDEKIKSEVIDETFKKFHEEITSEMANA